jgi:hypothetical protein
VPIVLKSVSLNLLEPSGPVKACNGIALPFLRQSCSVGLCQSPPNMRRCPKSVDTLMKFFARMRGFSDVTGTEFRDSGKHAGCVSGYLHTVMPNVSVISGSLAPRHCAASVAD